MSRIMTIALAFAALTVANAGFAQGVTSGFSMRNPLPSASLPGIVYKVQSNESFRINELEEEIRRLNGKVEELNFLLLQLQEKFRKMEEDNEGRFQDLEDERSSIDGDYDTSVASTDTDGKNRSSDRLGKPESSGADKVPDDSIKDSQHTENKTERPSDDGLEPRALGTLVFDKEGNVIDSNSGDGEKLSGLPGVLPDLFNKPTEGAVAAAEFGSIPSEVFQVGKDAYNNRDFSKAQQVFTAHINAWPKDPETGVVKYYLGESYFWQKEYYSAANAHLDAHNNYPEAETAADNLLALGLALAGLNQRGVACATYAEVLNQYPEAEKRLGAKVRDEQAATRC